MKMAWIATSPEGDTYAICSADPAFADDAATEIRQWRKDGAKIELLPQSEAKQRFLDCLPPKQPTPKQFGLFGSRV